MTTGCTGETATTGSTARAAGGAGSDYIESGLGDNIFVFGRGYGHDTVKACNGAVNKHNQVRLLGLGPDEITIRVAERLEDRWTHQDLVFEIKSTGETMTILQGFSGGYSYRIQSVEFGDGTVWSWDDIRRSGFHGAWGDDTLALPYNEAAALYGEGGNDFLTGSSYDDALYGGDGDDRIYGGHGDDILDGGSGHDYLEGGYGNDIYIFRAGDGRDTINNYDGSIGDDLLRLADLEAADLWFEKSGNHLVIRLVETDDRITVNNWYAGDYYKIGSIEAGNLALAYDQVGQMIQALAGLGAPGAADGQWTEDQREALVPIINYYWQPRA